MDSRTVREPIRRARNRSRMMRELTRRVRTASRTVRDPMRSLKAASRTWCDAMRTRHYSYRTEEAYVGWIRRFIFFHHKRHPAQMGKPEIEQFLTALAVDRHVSAATQN
jgi:hypothetical protein